MHAGNRPEQSLPITSLERDVDLITQLQDASASIQSKTLSLSEKLEIMDTKLRRVQTGAVGAELEFIRRKNRNPSRFEISDDDLNRGNGILSQDRYSSNISAECDETQAIRDQEIRAIRDGLEGLRFFHDYSNIQDNDHWLADHYFSEVIESASDYESTTSDVFNQRPLPFVIGTKLFMESSDGGLESEDGDSLADA
jgi:hypothetical protein